MPNRVYEFVKNLHDYRYHHTLFLVLMAFTWWIVNSTFVAIGVPLFGGAIFTVMFSLAMWQGGRYFNVSMRALELNKRKELWAVDPDSKP